MGTKLITPEDHIKHGKERLLKAFRLCMRKQFGSHKESGLPLRQHRDVCRTFAMGWAEALAAQCDAVALHYWTINFGDISSPDWWPDQSWVFWD